MIDSTKERLFPVSQLDEYVASNRRNKRLHPSTGYRWAIKGKNGIKLEVLHTPGGMQTSREAISRFFRALSAKAGIVEHAPPVEVDMAHRQAEIERASARVAALTR